MGEIKHLRPHGGAAPKKLRAAESTMEEEADEAVEVEK
jgi:hypothetical protein